MNRNLVSKSEVRGWLVNEDENIKPYLRAWKGENPYNIISRMKFCIWAMVVTVVLTIIVSMFGPRNGSFIGSLIASFFFLSLYGWWEARKGLGKFCATVVWCEFEAIPENVLLRSKWTKEDVKDVLEGFVRIIRADILPLEREDMENHMFPKKSAEARALHDSRKARLVKEIRMISPMFSHFHGVDDPLGEAFRLAAEKPTPFAR